MKILILSTNSDLAGVPRHIQQIALGLSSTIDFIFVFGQSSFLSQILHNHGHRVFVIDGMTSNINPLSDLVSMFKLLMIVLNTKPDIIHCHSTKAGMIGRIVALFTHTKWLYTVHGWGWRGLSDSIQAVVIYIEKILSMVPRGFYIFVARDVMNQSYNILNINPKRCIVIHNGVSKPILQQYPSNDELQILMPARVCSAKDHSTLLKAFELFRNPQSRLVFCGHGTNSSEFISLAKSLAPLMFDNISFCGPCYNMNPLYSRADIVALTSHFEALPMVIIEAFSCSKAVVATNVGGISELITSGKNGLLVRHGNVGDVVDALTFFSVSETRSAFGLRAFESFQRCFSQEQMIESLYSVYHRISLGHFSNP